MFSDTFSVLIIIQAPGKDAFLVLHRLTFFQAKPLTNKVPAEQRWFAAS
jgi:hypothetical protein